MSSLWPSCSTLGVSTITGNPAAAGCGMGHQLGERDGLGGQVQQGTLGG
jgi:hypothetical protein